METSGEPSKVSRDQEVINRIAAFNRALFGDLIVVVDASKGRMVIVPLPEADKEVVAEPDIDDYATLC